ncbi:MAG: hypothetical protein ABSG77_04270 [Candidatus Acidiferrum sp.]|jgi:hypothetical protein
MQKVFCDRCENEIQRSDATGILVTFKVKISCYTRDRHGQIASATTDFEAELCYHCNCEVKTALKAVGLKRV